MTKKNAGEREKKRRQAYEHVLASVRSSYEVLIDCCHEIDDIGLEAAKNNRDLNTILHWVREVSSEIYRQVPELAPPPSEPPPRRWPVDPDEAPAWQGYTRDQALSRVRHQLELVRLILRECGPLVVDLKLNEDDLGSQLSSLISVHRAVVAEIWKDRSDSQRRGWIRDWGLPDGFIEPPAPDRRDGLERLNQKLETAAKTLDDCAGLAVELELEADVPPLRAIGTCLSTIFGIQDQIYVERPDLIPLFLKEAYELRERENEEREST